MRAYGIEYDLLVVTVHGDTLPKEHKVEMFYDAQSFISRLKELHGKEPKEPTGCFVEIYENITTSGGELADVGAEAVV